MGDYFQSIVDVEVSAEQAPELADRLVGWLVGEGIVAARLIPCVLGADAGHPPGPRYTAAVVEPNPAWEPFADEDFPGPRSDGMRVRTGRSMYDCEAPEHITCPHCDATVPLCDEEFQPNGTWEQVWAVIDDWHADGDGCWDCPRCDRAVGLNDWRWSPPWAFGCLGFTFWNWTPLRPAFVAEVSRRLGHRVVCPSGWL